MNDQIRDLADQLAGRLETELRTKFMPIPAGACGCGKPVVFIHPRRKFHCSRCGRNWELIVEIKEKLPPRKRSRKEEIAK